MDSPEWNMDGDQAIVAALCVSAAALKRPSGPRDRSYANTTWNRGEDSALKIPSALVVVSMVLVLLDVEGERTVTYFALVNDPWTIKIEFHSETHLLLYWS